MRLQETIRDYQRLVKATKDCRRLWETTLETIIYYIYILITFQFIYMYISSRDFYISLIIGVCNTAKIFNDQITSFIVKVYLLIVSSHSQYLKLQENSWNILKIVFCSE